MEELFQFQTYVLAQVNQNFTRYLLPKLYANERLLGIKGLGGVGKTTLLLQYLKYQYENKKQGLYVSADHPYFYTHSLFDTAQLWYQSGGKLLIIDEVHKYENWSRELKLIYDGFPDFQVLFTSSSALNLFRGESDLSRRLIVQNLNGMSFREFLNFRYGQTFEAYSLEDIITHHIEISSEIVGKIKILPHFQIYLKNGYFPFVKNEDDPLVNQRIIQVVNTILEVDLMNSMDYSAANINKLKKLLGIIAESPPFEPNITKIANRLNISRNKVYDYIYELGDALLVRNMSRTGKGMSRLQKPDKIYFENTSLAHTMTANADMGSIRETFFLNQLSNANHTLNLVSKGDFVVDGQYTFEVGGKNKTNKQIAGISNAFIAMDGIEVGFAHKIPLWLFGFLY
ncbi:ATP-binding protein [Riemerella columbina]|uniref:ATP-binding protein n=1 Tax=Riemerella columbina TaxID=103810 RepID=UPI000373C797|nr:AAA family ATPase [Riemerella columbina]